MVSNCQNTNFIFEFFFHFIFQFLTISLIKVLFCFWQKSEKQIEKWDKTFEKLIDDNLKEISAEDFIAEKSMRKAVNL